MIFSLNGLSIPIIDINMAVKGQQVLQATALSVLDSTNQKITLPIPMRGVQTMSKGQEKCFYRTNQLERQADINNTC